MLDSSEYGRWILSSIGKISDIVDAAEMRGIVSRLNKMESNIAEFLQGVSELSVIEYFSENQYWSPIFPRKINKDSKDIDVSYTLLQNELSGIIGK